jgi:hypothetical protein
MVGVTGKGNVAAVDCRQRLMHDVRLPESDGN